MFLHRGVLLLCLLTEVRAYLLPHKRSSSRSCPSLGAWQQDGSYEYSQHDLRNHDTYHDYYHNSNLSPEEESSSEPVANGHYQHVAYHEQHQDYSSNTNYDYYNNYSQEYQNAYVNDEQSQNPQFFSRANGEYPAGPLTPFSSSRENGQPLRRFDNERDIFDELWEDTNRMFGLMDGLAGGPTRSGTLLERFFDAPLESRRRGSLLSRFFKDPIGSPASSSLPSIWGGGTATMVEQMRQEMRSMQDSVTPLLQEAERRLNQDKACTAALGSNIQVGPVVSQSSAASSYNGQSQATRLQIEAAVQGSDGISGMIQATTSNDGMVELILRLDDDGREINVVALPEGGDTSWAPFNFFRRADRRGDRRGFFGNRENPNDAIVDAEIVDDDNNNSPPSQPRGVRLPGRTLI